MKFKRMFAIAFTAVSMLAAALLLASCGAFAPGAEQGDTAQDNRQYMASLNQQMFDLQEAMNDFQDAVSNQNTVAMKTAMAEVEKVLATVDNQKAPDSLKDVKKQYSAALTSLNDAMSAYVDVYEQVQEGSLNGSDAAEEIEKVQDAYDESVDLLKDADEAVSKLAE